MKGIGFFVYREMKTSFPLQFYNSSGSVTNVSISVSGPLREHVSLVSNDRLWKGDGFTRINPGEVKVFYTNLEGIPEDMVGMHQLKYSVTYATGSASHRVWVAVLPFRVISQGRDPPVKGTVGVSRAMMRMSYGNTTVPVEVVMQVW
jgi:hypothetical protein